MIFGNSSKCFTPFLEPRMDHINDASKAVDRSAVSYLSFIGIHGCNEEDFRNGRNEHSTCDGNGIEVLQVFRSNP